MQTAGVLGCLASSGGLGRFRLAIWKLVTDRRIRPDFAVQVLFGHSLEKSIKRIWRSPRAMLAEDRALWKVGLAPFVIKNRMRIASCASRRILIYPMPKLALAIK